MMLSLDTAYRSFGGEVEASSTPTICRLSDSRRHQLWAIAAFLSTRPQRTHRVDCRRVVLRLHQGHRTRPFGLATALRSVSRLVRGHASLRHRKRLGQAEGISRGLPGCRCETSGVRRIDSTSRSQRPCVLACPPCTCERHHRRYATTDSQSARSRPQRPMPLWLWQEVQALPWSTEIVALTCGTQNCLRPPSSLLKRPRQACCATPVQDQKCWNTAAFEQSQFIDHTRYRRVLRCPPAVPQYLHRRQKCHAAQQSRRRY